MRSFQACFSEFSFAPYTGLGSEWVQLRLERSFALWLWWGARCAGSIGVARLVPGLEGVTVVPGMGAVPQAAGPEGLQCTWNYEGL